MHTKRTKRLLVYSTYTLANPWRVSKKSLQLNKQTLPAQINNGCYNVETIHFFVQWWYKVERWDSFLRTISSLCMWFNHRSWKNFFLRSNLHNLNEQFVKIYKKIESTRWKGLSNVLYLQQVKMNLVSPLGVFFFFDYLT